jgi:hypothetical protein
MERIVIGASGSAGDDTPRFADADHRVSQANLKTLGQDAPQKKACLHRTRLRALQ